MAYGERDRVLRPCWELHRAPISFLMLCDGFFDWSECP